MRVAGEQHAGHRGHDGQAGDQDGAAGGGGGDVDRLELAGALRALFTFAPDVEQRVVDADREADEDDRRHRDVVDRERLADERDDTARAEHGRQGEDDGHGGGDERAEREGEDEQRHAEGHELRVAFLGRGGVVELLGHARVAELLDGDALVARGDLARGVEDRLDAVDRGVRIALEVELDEDRVTVLGDGVGGDVGDGAVLADAGRDVVDRGLEGGVISGLGLALDEHHLAALLREAGVGEDRLGTAGLAVHLLRVGRGLLAERAADDERDQDECEPSEDGGLAVPGTPVPGPGGNAFGLGERHGGFTSPGGSRLVRRGSNFRARFSPVAPGVCGVLHSPPRGTVDRSDRSR